ncbi:MAG: hypothetical protein AUH92_05585 [Acidobacteria bacterium 13_1_40CM_4_69_4]|nr:MAG: hypothetical protein AUH92_05585 [Acidobacteria bacterium 13_1_40CM_4_69_4]
MRKLFILSLAAVCILGLATMSMAAQKTTTKSSSHHAVGEVVSVDPANNTFTIKENVKGGGEAKELTFNFDAKGKVMVAGKPGKLDDLKSGDSATVRYTEREGKMIAQEIRVAKPAASKASSK